LLESGTGQLSPYAELSLMFAARAQHIEEVIRPALEAGKVVLSDRFTDSSEAYQGGGRELGSDAVLALHEVLCGGLQPDLTILMDSDVAASVARARRRNVAASANGHDENRFERENRSFFARVHAAYHAIVLSGTQGSGKYTLAQMLAKTMKCLNTKTTSDGLRDFCGVCLNCVRITEADDLEARCAEAEEARENLRETDKKETRLFIQT